tara:strand:- start:529 stop:636 length:108 start_codon:yes stop_codon:yes gene_type:complete
MSELAITSSSTAKSAPNINSFTPEWCQKAKVAQQS